MQKLKHTLENMEYNDLLDLHAKIDKGTFSLDEEVKKYVREKQKQHQKFCAICGNDLSPEENNFTIMFGPEDFKRKASFCALDCMKYFIDKMK